MAAGRGRELGLVLRELAPVAGVGDVDGGDDGAGRRIQADFDLAALGAAAGGSVDLDVLGVGEVQVGELERGAVLRGADGLAGILAAGDFGGLGFELTVAESDDALAGQRARGAGAGVGDDGFEEQGAGLVILRRGQLAFEAAGEGRAALALLEGEHPAEHDGDFVLGVLRVGEHRDLAPDAAAAEADLLVEEVVGAGLLAVFVGDGDERRTDELRLDGVAVEAIALAHQREARVDRHGLAVGGKEGGGHQRAGGELGGLGFGGAVFGVLRGDLEIERLAGREEVAVLRGEEADGRHGVADDDGDRARHGAALAVGDGEFDVEVARGLEGHGQLFAFAELLVAGLQFPGVAQLAAVEVARALGGERGLER